MFHKAIKKNKYLEEKIFKKRKETFSKTPKFNLPIFVVILPWSVEP